MPCAGGTHIFLQEGPQDEELRTPINSQQQLTIHVSWPSKKQTLQLQSSFQMTTTLANMTIIS